MRTNRTIIKYILLSFFCTNIFATTNVEKNTVKYESTTPSINNKKENKGRLQAGPVAFIAMWLLKDVFFEKFKTDLQNVIADNTYGIIYKEIFGSSDGSTVSNQQINKNFDDIIDRQITTIKTINANHHQIIDLYNLKEANEFASIQTKISANLDSINQYLYSYSSIAPTNIDINKDTLDNMSFSINLKAFDKQLKNSSVKTNLLKKLYTIANNEKYQDYWRSLSFSSNLQSGVASNSSFNLDTYFTVVYNEYSNLANEIKPNMDSKYVIYNTNITNPDNVSEKILATNNLFLHKKTYDDFLYTNTLKAAYALELVYKYELLAAYAYYNLNNKDIALPSTFINGGAPVNSYEEAEKLLNKKLNNAYKNLSKGLLKYQNKFNIENYIKGDWYIKLFSDISNVKQSDNINNFLSLNPNLFFEFDENNNLERNLIYFDGMYLRVKKENLYYPIHTNVSACSEPKLTSNGSTLQCSSKEGKVDYADDTIKPDFVDLINNYVYSPGVSDIAREDATYGYDPYMYDTLGNIIGKYQELENPLYKNMRVIASTIPNSNYTLKLNRPRAMDIPIPNANGTKQYYLMSYKGNMFYIANVSTKWYTYLIFNCIKNDNNCSMNFIGTPNDYPIVEIIFKDGSKLTFWRSTIYENIASKRFTN